MKYPAVVDMHLPGGFTKLRVSISGGHYFDVPTESIPLQLRSVGSKVILYLDPSIRADSVEEARALSTQAVRVEDPAVSNKKGQDGK